MCRRRWAFAYLADQRDQGGFATEAGKRVHALLEEAGDGEPAVVEQWVTTQIGSDGEERIVVYDLTRMAHALWRKNPGDPNPEFERDFVKELFGIPFKGVVDRLSAKYILDYKTTGGLLKYAKTPFKLKTDVQRLVYWAAYPETEYSLWLTGTFANSEGAKKDPDAIPYEVRASLLRNEPARDTEAFKLHVLTPAEEIAAVVPGTDPMSFPLPDNALAFWDSPCKKFPPDGCPHYKTCHPKTSKFSLKVKPPVEAIQLVPAPTPVEVSVTPEFLIENLYIDCFPMFQTDEPVVFGHQYVHRAEREVATDRGLDHALLADFAKGPPMVAMELVAQLELIAPIKHFYLETKTNEGRGVLNQLMGRSRQVYKGMF
jgi:hypothetical protein